jgi:UDP-N-acetylglucosamine 2-epimerase (non-hydrolysing)
MFPYKIVTLVGTRPELIKLSAVIKEVDKHFAFHTLVHTGQHYDYELNAVFFKDFDLRQPDLVLAQEGENSTMGAIGDMLSFVDWVMEFEKPDAVLIYGDTNSALGAYVAKRKRVPIFHMEAGNRCFDPRVPEEINRKIVDHISDINMTISEYARQNLINEGLPTQRIFKVGSSMGEVLALQKDKIEKSNVKEALGLEANNYLVLSIHREENVMCEGYLNVLLEFIETFDLCDKIVFSVHPRTRKLLLAKNKDLESLPQLVFMKPFCFSDYICLQKDAFCTVSDSGTLMEEASLCGFPAVTIRDAYERPEGMEYATAIVSDWDIERIKGSIALARNIPQTAIVHDYNEFNVSHKVCKILASYIPIIKKTTWRES